MDDVDESLVDVPHYDVVFHLAACVNLSHEPDVAEECVVSNVLGTQHLLEALAKNPPGVLVYASTQDVYAGGGLTPWYEEQREAPSSPYGATKLAGEHLCRVSGLPVAVARLSTVYGPGQNPERLIPSAIRAFRRREALAVGKLAQHRDLVYVDDAVDGLLGLAAHPGQTVNLGHTRPVSLRLVVEQLREMADPGAPEPRYGVRPERAGEPDVWSSSGRNGCPRWPTRLAVPCDARL